MHILSVKKICLCYFHYQKIEIIFETNIVICHSYLFFVPYFPFDNSWVMLISKSKNLTVNELVKQKKINNYHIKDSHKEKVPPNKTPPLMESTNMGVWAVVTLSQLFIRGS